MPTLLPHQTALEQRSEQVYLYQSKHALGEVPRHVAEWLHQYAEQTPDHPFLAERSGEGWRKPSYLDCLQQVRNLAQSIVAAGLTAETPILVISGNSVNHALVSLAAQYVGVPVVPVAEQYALIEAAHPRLQYVFELTQPGMVYAEDGQKYAAALGLEWMANTPKLVSVNVPAGMHSFDQFLKGDSADIDSIYSALTPDSVAKILLTSGSTSNPKGVRTTQRMMCTNQVQLATALPFVAERPPVVVDWLPWNHVFGGSHNFNLMLANGGTFYIDEGKPVKGLFEKTLENLSLQSATLSFNVPVGFAMLLEALNTNKQLRDTYFAELDMMFYAGASLPQPVWQGLEDAAMASIGEVPLMTSSWGLTETAPAAVLQHQRSPSSGVVGVPLPGVDCKLIDDGEGRFEVRVKGPSIFGAYHNSPDKTAEAFDEEGFFITGDAMKFVDPSNPDKGLRFDGRISEDFKLLTGTWVRAANLRLDILPALAGIASDIVICGHNRDEIGLLVFLTPAMAAQNHLQIESGSAFEAQLANDIRSRIAQGAWQSAGSSMRVGRVILTAEQPSIGEGEITAKGNLNFNKILSRRADVVARLYSDHEHVIKVGA